MSKAWLRAKRQEFVCDVLRDFCMASKTLNEEFSYYDQCFRVRFDVLRDLIGEEMNKGLLWRLKDTSHHLFRGDPEVPLIGKILDWAIGYIFHEGMKLKEDAYQSENYVPWFKGVQQEGLTGTEREATSQLYQVLMQTKESVEREIRRIRFIINHCIKLFPLYLADYKDNALLARFLYQQKDLVRQVFGNKYEDLVRTIYEDEPEQMYILAARSLRQGGWMNDAQKALEAAVELKPGSQIVLQEKKVVDILCRQYGS